MTRTLHAVGTKGGGGAESFLARLASALHERGHPAHVAARAESPVPELAEGVPATRVAMRNSIDIVSMWRIRRLARRLEIDVVQTYMNRATELTRLGRSGPVHVGRLGNFYRLAPYRHCDAWIGNTRGICDYMVKGGFPAGRVHHIYNFVDVPEPVPAATLERLRADLGIPADALVLVSPGRFVPRKGFDVLIRALAGIPESVGGRPVVPVLVGDGPSAGDLRALADTVGVADRIRWTGWVDGAGPYYDLADLVVFPPRREEPFGNVTLEAWSHGAPLVTTGYLGAEEFVRADEDAVVVACEDPSALAGAVEELLRDDEARRALGRRGLARLRTDFGVETIVARYLELYDTLTAAGARAL